MMGTVPALHLKRDQLAQMLAVCTAYRAYLWQYLTPTPERNLMLRGVQSLQGRLEKAQEQGQENISLSLTAEEKSILKQLLGGLTQFYGAAPPSEQRTQKLGELAALRLLVERAFRQTQAL
jgi:hypothetical protein